MNNGKNNCAAPVILYRCGISYGMLLVLVRWNARQIWVN